MSEEGSDENDNIRTQARLWIEGGRRWAGSLFTFVQSLSQVALNVYHMHIERCEPASRHRQRRRPEELQALLDLLTICTLRLQADDRQGRAVQLRMLANRVCMACWLSVGNWPIEQNCALHERVQMNFALQDERADAISEVLAYTFLSQVCTNGDCVKELLLSSSRATDDDDDDDDEWQFLSGITFEPEAIMPEGSSIDSGVCSSGRKRELSEAIGRSEPRKKRGRAEGENNKKASALRYCKNCGGIGHYRKNCPQIDIDTRLEQAIQAHMAKCEANKAPTTRAKAHAHALKNIRAQRQKYKMKLKQLQT